MRTNPHNPDRTPCEVSDESGKSYRCDNGNIIAEVFASSPMFRREAPAMIEDDGVKYGPDGTDGKRIVRTFVDADTALENAEVLIGHRGTRDRDAKLDAFLKRRWSSDPSAIAAADRLFDELTREINIETLTASLQTSVVGGSPCVGNYLTGSPMSMYRMTSDLDPSGTVRVFVDLSTSSSMSKDSARGRGIALLALVSCLQRLRPVELWVGTNGTATTAAGDRAHTCFLMRASTAPIDIGVASRLLADPMVQNLGYHGECRSVGIRIGTQSGLGWSSIPFAVTCGATEQDIVIGPLHANAKSLASGTITPVQFVRDELTAWLERSGNSTAAMSLAAL